MFTQRDEWITMSGEALLKKCEQDFFIASGKGGQHRNRTESAVRLIHKESQISVYDTTSRHREENRKHAIKKLRLAFAFQLRCPPQPQLNFPPPSIQNETYPLWVAHFLDFFDANHLQISTTAKAIGTSTAQLIKALQKNPMVWQHISELQKRQREKALDA